MMNANVRGPMLQLASLSVLLNPIHAHHRLVFSLWGAAMASMYAATKGAWLQWSGAGTAEEAASVALFLLSDDASYVTGSQQAVDGRLIHY
ncbi:SDR family oxidoreductase [Cronobacter turicensis]|nr:SDR family oxidoreductase [Cronobacter turicensis]EKY3212699.1 SDR family oxidoreductase [Cronobacter turicensis]EKY3217010.1 SDR family oxidoreductase [Cronobacter turicensis]